jgi:hypothetical protein
LFSSSISILLSGSPAHASDNVIAGALLTLCAGGVYVPEQDGGHHGDPDRPGSADCGGHLQPAGECLARAIKQRRADLVG